MMLKTEEIHLKGMSVSHGIAIGKAFYCSAQGELVPSFSISASEVESEILRYRRAIGSASEELARLQKQLQNERVVEGAAILDSYLQIIKDPLFTEQVESRIRLTLRNAEQVLEAAVNDYKRLFDKISDPFFSERFKDIQDVSRRTLRILREHCRDVFIQAPSGSIIFAEELTASDVAEASIKKVNAFVTASGGGTSHAAIVAKAKGIPYVTGIVLEGLDLSGEVSVIVDGRSGDVFLHPTPETMEKYVHLKGVVATHFKNLNDTSCRPPETYDGYVIRLSANIEEVDEIGLIHQYGGHGVGLFRSEYELLTQESFPTEEEQFQTYRAMVEMMKGLPIVMRTFDIGGDKQMYRHSARSESNPIMGCRAIRFLLQEKGIFKNQLRAMLRASVYGNVSILFPMVSALSELLEAKRCLAEAQEELKKGAVPFAADIRVGCMIEVPSAALIADLLAKECDFLSIGTNDLVQYSLAVDRGNHAVRELYTPAHPSVIRLIKLVIHEANQEGIPVVVCGEIAADPRFTSLLLGLGVHELSVAPRYIPAIKNAIRASSIVEATALAEQVMGFSSAMEIQAYLSREYQRLVPDDCLYNGVQD